MNDLRSETGPPAAGRGSGRIRLDPAVEAARRWREAEREVADRHRAYATLEAAYLEAGRPAGQVEANTQAALIAYDEADEALVDARRALYRSAPATPEGLLALAEVIRASEEDVFEDEDLAAAFDTLVAGLRRKLGGA